MCQGYRNTCFENGCNSIGKPYNDSPILVSREELITYQGSFQEPKGAVKKISFQEGSLVYYDKGGRKVSLIPIGKRQFKLGEELSYLEFTENKELFKLKTTGLESVWARTSEEPLALQSIAIPSSTLQKVFR